MLTLRLARLLEEDDTAAALGITFTNKAAAEMRERVDHILGEYTDRAQLCTFHKFAADILGQHGSHLGMQSGRTSSFSPRMKTASPSSKR